ncbi:MAG: replicative DNA helicase [Methylococcales bacterium]|jgi:replicative DNA helicase|nr:replicative DNA helicase [Methylococcales bacterium]
MISSDTFSITPDRKTEGLKVPPNSIQAEQSVLGGLMLDGDAWEKISDQIIDNDFYRREHRVIFQSIQDLFSKDSPCDLVTLKENLEQRSELDNIGGVAYLATLANDTPTAANIQAYAEIVRERSILRQLIRAGTEIADLAFQPDGENSDTLLEQAEQKVFQIAEQRQDAKVGFESVKSLLSGAVEKIQTLYDQDEPVTGVSTGFADLDKQTSGLQPADLIIVAGRPSMGKTTLAMNIAENIAIESQKAVAVFSMEMPGEALAMRMMSSLGRIDQHKVRTGKLSDDDWPRLTSAISLLSEAPLFIDDSPALTPADLRSRARRLVREQKTDLGLIVIDYIQLMRSHEKADNRTGEVSAISRGLKSLAKELDVPVIALSQLNRNLEQRPNKRPVMADLRESGSIEQDADLIVFIYRDEVYNPESPEKGKAEIIISKQRNGPIGTINLTFMGQYTKFENFAPEMGVSERYS